MFGLVDSHSRTFVYLRLSVTDRCGFRCVYCLPNGYQPPETIGSEPTPELTIDEIRRLVAGFAGLGVWKIRLTGGEPTIRRDIVEIAQVVASVPGIRRLGITTNGNRLAELAAPLRKAGVTSVNISVDSLDQENFEKITGTDRFPQVMHGVDQALAVGFESIKINALLLRETDESELSRFIAWVRERPVSVRFIELMRTGNNSELFEKRHLSGGVVQFELQRSGWTALERKPGDGPAVVYRHPDYAGTIGIIAPYSPDFCGSCNRLRVSSRGALRLCLFGDQDHSLRDCLANDNMQEQLMRRIRSLILDKPASHFLHEGKYGNTSNLSGIGG